MVQEVYEKSAKHSARLLHILCLSLYEQRLTGKHETASIHDFSYEYLIEVLHHESHYHCSKGWKGWLEDRRPASNGDPYKIAARIIKQSTLF
jgi:glutamine synthetase